MVQIIPRIFLISYIMKVLPLAGGGRDLQPLLEESRGLLRATLKRWYSQKSTGIFLAKGDFLQIGSLSYLVFL